MRIPRSISLASCCLVLLLLGLPTPSAAAPPDGEDGGDAVVLSDEMVHSYLDFARSSAPAGTGGSLSTGLEGSCHQGTYEDDHGDAPRLDLWAYGTGYFCAERVWLFGGDTDDSWSPSSLDGIVVGIDRDRSASTGCEGADTVVVATPGAAGVVFSSPSCNESAWVVTGSASGAYDAPGSGAVVFSASAIANDQEFRWAVVLVSTAGTSDRAPSTGWRDMRLPCGVGSTAFTKTAARTVSGLYDDMASGDFDGDGVDDLFFYGRGTAPDGLLQGSASGLLPVAYRPPVNLSYDGIASGDFDGDGADDLFFYGEGSRQDGYLLAQPGTFALAPVKNAVQVTRAYDGLVAGDFNGDGLDDVFFYGAGSHPDGLLKGTALGLRAVAGSTQVSRSYDEVQAGDFDGDGFDDIAFYGRGGAPEGLLRGSPGWLIPTTPGVANGVYAEMRPGDFDGDGFDDLFFYQPGTSCEGLLRGRSTGPMIGVATPGVDGTYDDFESGDFDGDGDDDLFFYGRGGRAEGQLLGR